MATRRYLDVRYDVTDLSPDEVAYLAGEAHAQAESSDGPDGHPGVEVESETVEVEEEERLPAAPEVIVRLSGVDVIDVEPPGASVEVRQYHADVVLTRPNCDAVGTYAVEYPRAEAEEDEEEVDELRDALDRAHDRSYLKLGDDDLDIYYEEIARVYDSSLLTGPGRQP